jgi:hypothetical protein
MKIAQYMNHHGWLEKTLDITYNVYTLISFPLIPNNVGNSYQKSSELGSCHSGISLKQ